MTKNLERKKKKTSGRTNRRRPIFSPMIQFVIVSLYTRFEVSILNSCGDIFDKKSGRKEKGTNKRKNKQEKAHYQSHDTTCRCEPVYQIYKVSIFNGCEISLTKNLERKKKGQTQGRTNRRMPICNPTIQLVVVNLYTKYEVSILNGCGDIFDEKFEKKEKGTNTRKNK